MTNTPSLALDRGPDSVVMRDYLPQEARLAVRLAQEHRRPPPGLSEASEVSY